jgi:DNA replication protein DnaC
MLTEPTMQKLHELKLDALAQAWTEQQRDPHAANLSFDERLGLLVDSQYLAVHNKRIQRALREAKLRICGASLQTLDCPEKRNLERAQLAQLAGGQYIEQHLSVLITGATGTGKTFLACALGEQACTQGYRVLYVRLPRLLQELALAHADGTYARVLARLLRTDLLILDEWGLSTLTEAQSRDVLEVLEDRYDRRATVVASQLPLDRWHQWLSEPTLADAILDRLVHRSYRFVIKGPSKRKDEPTPNP